MLNEYEQKKYDTISKLVSKEIDIKEAMSLLELQEAQIYRLKKKFIDQGIQGFIHGNRGKESPNKKDPNIIKELEELYLEKHFDFNFEHFYEDHVYGNYDISYDVMLKRFTEDDIISPLAHKKTVKAYKDKMNELLGKMILMSQKKQLNFLNQELFKQKKLILEDLIIYMYLVKKYKWMHAIKYGLEVFLHSYI